MRWFSGVLALAVVLAVSSFAHAQRGPSGPGGPERKKDGLGKFGPDGRGPGGKKDGPGNFGRGGPEDLRQLQAEVERLRATLRELEARLERLKQGPGRMAGGFGGPPFGGHGRMGSPPKKDGFGPRHGPESGRFGPPPGRGRERGEFGPPGKGHGPGDFGRFPGGPRGGFASPPGGGHYSSIDRKLDLIQKELDEIRRELHGSRR